MSKVKLEETPNRRRLHIGSIFVDLNETDYLELIKIFSSSSAASMREDWIELKDKKPEISIVVWVKHTHGKKPALAWLDYQQTWQSINSIGVPEDFNDVFNYEYEENHITHWRPIAPSSIDTEAGKKEERIECRLDQQQCQQECEHKSDRTKCPFTNPPSIDNDTQKEEWTAVEDELPEVGEIIDTWNGKSNRRARLVGYQKLFERYIDPIEGERRWVAYYPDITHWKKLSSPPKTK